LLIKAASYARDESGRYKYSRQNQRHPDYWTGNLLHSLEGRFPWRQAIVNVAFDSLDHDDCVINDQSDRQNQSKQRERVDGKSEQGKEDERADQRNRHGQQRD
jgi:hypothetical protein